MFSKEEIEEFRKITLWDVIVNSTDIPSNSVQQNVFMWKEGDPCPQPLQLNTSLLEPCKHLNGYDYFEVLTSFGFKLYIKEQSLSPA